MTAWTTIKVDKLPSIKDRKPFTTYKINGVEYVPNNMFDYGEPTHWVLAEDFWNDLCKELEEEEE